MFVFVINWLDFHMFPTANRAIIPVKYIAFHAGMYRMKRQMRIEDFIFPYGQLNKNNEWGKLADLVPWEEAEEAYARQFVNNGHPAHPARIVFRDLDFSGNGKEIACILRPGDAGKGMERSNTQTFSLRRFL